MDEEHPPLGLTPKQCRQARELLGWTQADLASESGVRAVDLARFEAEVRGFDRPTMAVLVRALEGAGLDLVAGRVRLRDEPSANEAILPGPAAEAS